jgi:hypothetical protein
MIKVETTDKDFDQVSHQKEKNKHVSNFKDHAKDLSKEIEDHYFSYCCCNPTSGAAVLMGIFIPKALEQKANVTWESS